jgi:Family of unknown function (DUF6502)
MQAFNAVVEIIAPLMVAEGISSREAESSLRTVFVRTTASLEGSTEPRSNAARVALLTGVDRHVVASILRGPRPVTPDREKRRHRLNRVLTEWHEDPNYTVAGQPKELDIRTFHRRRSFWTLAKTYAKDIYPGLILKELLKVEAIERLPNGRVRPLMRSYKASGLGEDGIDEIAQRVRDLTRTLLNNLSATNTQRVCGTVQTIDVDEKTLPFLRRALEARSAATLVALDQLLNNPKWRSKDPSVRRVRAGWTCYSFEESLIEDDEGSSGNEKQEDLTSQGERRTSTRRAKARPQGAGPR